MPEPTTYDKVLASNIRAARGRADISQAACAARMKALGFTQIYGATIGAIERGDRRVTAWEVVGLALCLETTPDVLVLPPPEVRQVRFGEHLIPAQRLSIVDDSVSWAGSDLKVTPSTEVYRPADLRQAVWAMREELRRLEAGETTLAPMQPGDLAAEDLPTGWRAPEPPDEE
jgi:hypothetical protein